MTQDNLDNYDPIVGPGAVPLSDPQRNGRRIEVPDSLEQRCPATASHPGAGGRLSVDLAAGGRIVGGPRADSASPVGAPAEIPHQVRRT